MAADGWDAAHPGSGLLGEVAHGTHALLAFFALPNIDELMARVVLDAHTAGLYAAGLVLTKAVLFLPQFVVIVAFPAMARGGAGRRTQAVAIILVLTTGAITTAGVAALSASAWSLWAARRMPRCSPGSGRSPRWARCCA